MAQEPDDATPTNDYASPSRTALDHLTYALSLPERVVRSGSGLVGGLARESAELLVPQSFKSSRTYSAMVQQMLDFMVHDIGGVAQDDKPSSTAEIDNYVARKAVGNFLDMASLATLHLSPLVILAAVSDIAYGSQAYLTELTEELKKQGVIDEQSNIRHVNDLLGAVSHATAATGKAFDTPPLSIDGLKQTIEETRAAIAARQTNVPSQAEVDRVWSEMRQIADREGVDMLAVGGATTMQTLGPLGLVTRGALSSAQVAGKLFERHIVDHYAQALDEMRAKGFYQSVSESSAPYIACVWDNFHASRSTITEDLLSGKLIGNAWKTVRSWLGAQKPEADSTG